MRMSELKIIRVLVKQINCACVDTSCFITITNKKKSPVDLMIQIHLVTRFYEFLPSPACRCGFQQRGSGAPASWLWLHGVGMFTPLFPRINIPNNINCGNC